MQLPHHAHAHTAHVLLLREHDNTGPEDGPSSDIIKEAVQLLHHAHAHTVHVPLPREHDHTGQEDGPLPDITRKAVPVPRRTYSPQDINYMPTMWKQ